MKLRKREAKEIEKKENTGSLRVFECERVSVCVDFFMLFHTQIK